MFFVMTWFLKAMLTNADLTKDLLKELAISGYDVTKQDKTRLHLNWYILNTLFLLLESS